MFAEKRLLRPARRVSIHSVNPHNKCRESADRDVRDVRPVTQLGRKMTCSRESGPVGGGRSGAIAKEVIVAIIAI